MGEVCCDLVSGEFRREACDLLDLKREYLDGIGDGPTRHAGEQEGSRLNE